MRLPSFATACRMPGGFLGVLSGLTLLVWASVWSGCVPSAETNKEPNGQTGPDTKRSPQYATGCMIPTPESFAAMPKAIMFLGAGELPAAVDLVVSGRVPPIGDQKNCGSCVGFANAYCLATYMAAGVHGWSVTTANHQGSPAYLMEKCVEVDPAPCCQGAYPDTALGILVRTGTASLQSVPYSASMAAGISCTTNSPESDAANFKIGSYHAVDPKNRNAVKSELAGNRVVSWGGYLYDDFMNATGSAVYRGSGRKMPNSGHAMTLVGYDENKGAYRLMNSWGTAWGDNGFMWIAYEAFEDMAEVAYVAEPASSPPSPDPDPEPNTPPGPGPDPTPVHGYLLNTFQYAVPDYYTGTWYVYLIFPYMFDQPVFIRTVTVTAPDGSVGRQAYNMWYQAGYVYFVRWDGYQWLTGTYYLEFDTLNQDGSQKTHHGQAYIAPLSPTWWGKAKPITFRGKVLTPSTGNDRLPQAGVKRGIAGANLQPAAVCEVP